MAEPPRARAKRLARRAGLDSAEPLWISLALRAHRAKLAANPAYRSWLESAGRDRVRAHWGDHDPVRGEFFELHLASQLYEITETLRARIGDLGDAPVLDAGASDGLFLSRIGARHGVGLNLLDHCVAQIAADGFEAVRGDVERMPFEDGRFAAVICCETLEHVPNPVAALDELARVTRGRIHLTIPWLRRTRINGRPAGWPHVESHIFELSEADFERVASHAAVRIVHREHIEVFPEPRNPLIRAWLSVLMYPNFFPRLQYYELEPA